MRPGSTLGQMLQASNSADQNAAAIYGTVVSIGAGTVDIVLDSRGGLLQRKHYTGTPRLNDRVKVEIVDGEYIAHCPVRST